MKKEIFNKWVPINGVPERLNVVCLHEDNEMFRLDLRGDDGKSKILRVSFDRGVTYRVHDEMDLMKTLDESEGLLNSKWCLFTVENSNYLAWYHEQSYDTRQSSTPIVHFAIYTPNDCIDMLSNYSPRVEWLE